MPLYCGLRHRLRLLHLRLLQVLQADPPTEIIKQADQRDRDHLQEVKVEADSQGRRLVQAQPGVGQDRGKLEGADARGRAGQGDGEVDGDEHEGALQNPHLNPEGRFDAQEHRHL